MGRFGPSTFIPRSIASSVGSAPQKGERERARKGTRKEGGKEGRKEGRVISGAALLLVQKWNFNGHRDKVRVRQRRPGLRTDWATLDSLSDSGLPENQ